MRKIAVVGLGRFGMELARTLGESKVQVIAIDRNGQLVNEVKDFVDLAVRIDATDPAALASQDIDKVDVCVVAIGENFEAALLTVVIAKQMGVPHVVCRAQTQYHADIFEKVGADEVIQPEKEAGSALARHLANPHLLELIRLSDGFTLLEFQAPEAFQNRSLKDLALRGKYNVNLVVIRKPVPESVSSSGTRTIVPKPDDVIEPGDVLVMVGAEDDLRKLPRE